MLYFKVFSGILGDLNEWKQTLLISLGLFLKVGASGNDLFKGLSFLFISFLSIWIQWFSLSFIFVLNVVLGEFLASPFHLHIYNSIL